MDTRRLKLSQHIAHADMPLHVSLVKVQDEVASHDHDFIEIAVILRGSCRHETLYEERHLTRGDVIILRPGVWHAYRDCRQLLVGNCGIGLALRQRELAWTQSDMQLGYLLWTGLWSGDHQGVLHLHIPEHTVKRTQRYLKQLDQQVNGADTTQRIKVMATLLQFLGECSQSNTSTIAESDTTSMVMHPAVQDAITLMGNDLLRHWTLSDLAELVQLDRAYLARLFGKQCGLPPMAYLNRLRLERAAGLLLQTQQSIGHIAMQVGMLDANYFTRRFHQHFGMTPSQMRQQNCGRN